MKVTGDRIIHTLQITIVALTIALRVVFFMGASKIAPAYDAELYWKSTLDIRNNICEIVAYCVPQEKSKDSITSLFIRGLFERSGIIPLWAAAVLTVLPPDIKTVYGILSLFDGINALLIMRILSRLKQPTWVTLGAGVLHALYVPGIIQSGSFLQQSPMRFGLTAIVYCLVVIWTTTDRRVVRSNIIRLFVFTLLTAFTTLPLRSLMWAVPVTLLGIAILDPSQRYVAKFAASGMAILFTTILVLGNIAANRIMVNVPGSSSPLTTTLLLIGGVSAGGETERSIVSFPYLWADANWISDNGRSLFSAFQSQPFEVLGRWLQSAVFNWRYPDYVYFQTFILGFQGQALQHGLYIVLGIIGLAWLLGQQGVRRYTAFTIVILAAFSTAIFALISVESRRLGLLYSLMAMLAALGVKGILDYVRPRPRLAPVLTLCGLLLVWCLPLDLMLRVAPLSAEWGYAVLAALRLFLSVVLGVLLIRSWQRQLPHNSRWPSGLFLGIVGIALVILLIQDEDRWRWFGDLPQGSKIIQTVTDFQLPPEQNAWVIVDVYPPESGTELILRVNGTMIKPAGEPMNLWEAGDPPRWEAYDVFGDMANTPISRQMWSAYKIPKTLLMGNKDIIEVEVEDSSGVIIAGDYITAPDRYFGPSLIPWYSGHSLWRWQWNGADPRIPMNHLLNGSYTSAYVDPIGTPLSTELTTGFPKHTGRYRVYLMSLPEVKIVDGLLVGETPPLESIEEIQ